MFGQDIGMLGHGGEVIAGDGFDFEPRDELPPALRLGALPIHLGGGPVVTRGRWPATLHT